MVLLLLACTAPHPKEGRPDLDTADTATDTSGDTAEPEAPWAILRDARTEDEGGDGRWGAGEHLWIDVVIENVIDRALPGIGVRAEVVSGQAEADPHGSYLFTLPVGESEEMFLDATPSPGLLEGDLVTLRLFVDTDNCATIPEQCPPLSELFVERTFGE